MSANRRLQEDEKWMRRSLRLAATRKGWTSPNPCVGAVIVKGGRIMGEGVHPCAGKLHAERYALMAAGEKARRATLYVNLEPCCHFGRTPPCTDALIAAGIRRVVAALRDPDRRVNGGGFKRLRKAGIECVNSVLEAEARRLNEDFIKFANTGRPFVTLKLAMSLDGKIATAKGESRWITGEKARVFAHRLRHEHDAVMVGIHTALVDDPELTCRLRGRHRNPHRIIVDTRARLPVDARCVAASRDARTILATTSSAPAQRLRALAARGVHIMQNQSRCGCVDLDALMEQLASHSMTSVLIEGGGTLAASALESGIVDKAVFIIAPRILGGASAKPVVGGRGVQRLCDAWQLHDVRVRRLGHDIVVEGYLNCRK